MRVVITENCIFIPRRKCRWPPHKSILLQKAQIHRCTFCKKSFFIIKIWIYGENIFKRWQIAINTWLSHSRMIESVICHIQGWIYVAYSLYKWKKYYFLNVRVPVLDTFLYTVLMFFCRTVAYLLMPKQSKNGGKRMETAAVHHSPICFAYIQSAIFTIRSRPTKLNNWPFTIKYRYRKVVKHERGLSFKKTRADLFRF